MLNDSPARPDILSGELTSRLATVAFYMALLSIGLFLMTGCGGVVMWLAAIVVALVALVLGGVSHVRLGPTLDLVGQKRAKAALVISGVFLGITAGVVLLLLRGLSQIPMSAWH